MIKPKILFRVDGNHKIGMGHFFRSLNLAQEFQKSGWRVIFLTQTLEVKKLLPKKFECIKLSSDKEMIKKIVSDLETDVIIIDKLEERSDLIRIFQKACKNVIAIDYTGNNKKLLKFGINILYPKTGLNNKYSFSGFEYTILNQSIMKTKPINIKRKSAVITVIQGGSDTHCFIPQIISALNYSSAEITIMAILGPSFKCWKELKDALKSNKKKIKILYNVKNMGIALSKSDLVITGGGMTLLETCHLGIPCAVVCGENFENETAKIMQKKGFGINVGFHHKLPKRKIALITEQLLDDYKLRKKMNRIGPRIIDGNGTKRIMKIIKEMQKQK